MNPTRIALVIAQTTGGIGHHVLRVVSEVVRRGGVVSVAGPQSTRGLGFEERGAAFFPVEISSWTSMVGTFSASRRLSRVLADTDLVHAHGIRAGIAAGIGSRRAGVEHRLVTIHNAVLDRRGIKRAAAWVGDRLLARLFIRRIAVSKDLAEVARSAAPRAAGTISVIPVGAELSTVTPTEIAGSRSFIGLPADAQMVVAAGRLDRQKGFDVLIDAMALVEHQPAPHLVIAGEGPARDELTTRAAVSGLTERLHLLGHRSDAGVFIASADVFCMPSRWEGSPLALHEAMAHSRAIVAADVGGIRDMVSDEGALLVAPESAEDLARAIQRLLDDPSLRRRLGESAAKMAAAWPDASASASLIADLYEEVLGRGLGTQ